MKLRYCQIDGGNFGDDLNTWLWPTLLGDSFLDENDAEWFLGVGSILSHDLPRESRKIVMGSGTGYKRPPVVDGSFDVFCVRGPHTAAAMSLPPEEGIADGAYLFSGDGMAWPHCRTGENDPGCVMPSLH